MKNILSTHDPALAKKLGRQVRGFDSNIWKGKREEIVYQGNLAKFSQNMPIQKYLLSTGTNILVEASPEDTIWGIGLSADSPDAKHPEHWKGLNLLGFILMNVRSVLPKTSF